MFSYDRLENSEMTVFYTHYVDIANNWKAQGNLIPGCSPQEFVFLASRSKWNIDYTYIGIVEVGGGEERRSKIMTINNLRLYKMLIEAIL